MKTKKKITLLIIVLSIISFITNAQINFQWVKNLGGTISDRGNSVAIDAVGNIYTTGNFTGTADFNPGTGVYNLTSSGNKDIFICKLNASGAFVWARKIGGVNADDGVSITVDAVSNVYITGNFYSTVDFDPGSGVYNLTSLGAEDIFICKLNSLGNFVWAKNIGGVYTDKGQSIAVDGDCNVYTTGFFKSTADFDPGTNVYNLTLIGVTDLFISKLDSSGSFVWAKNIGASTKNSMGNSITIDLDNNVYTTGYYSGIVDFDPGSGVYNLTSSSSISIFVSKLDSSGSFSWAKSMGGSLSGIGVSISVDDDKNVYTTGTFMGTADFDPGVATYNITSKGNTDIFISKLDSSGSFIWAKNIGGVGSTCYVYSIAVDLASSVYLTGSMNGTIDFDPNIGTYNITTSNIDIYINKLDAFGNFAWAVDIGGLSTDEGTSIAVDLLGNIYTTGYFGQGFDFDPTTSNFNLFSNGNDDCFVLKLNNSILDIRENSNSTFLINVYPNPISNELIIESNQIGKYYEIINLLGQVVFNGILIEKTIVNTSDFVNGVYLLKLEDSKSFEFNKIVKE